MMAPGSTRYRGAQQQNMFGTWHVQPMHAHKHTCVYTTTVLNIIKYEMCLYEHVFINWRQLNNSMDKKSGRWLGICLFVFGFLGHINFQYPEFGKTLFLHLNRQKESLLQTWWPFRSRHLDGFIAWISLAFSIPRLQPLDQLSCSLHLLQGFWTQAEGKGRTRNASNYDFNHNQTTWKYGEFQWKSRLPNLKLIVLWWLVGFHFGGKPSKLHCVQFFVVRIWHWISRQC